MKQLHFIVKGRVDYGTKIIHEYESGISEFFTIDDEVKHLHDRHVLKYDESLALKKVK